MALVVILGLDVALRCTGYGVVKAEGQRFTPLDCGVIRTTPQQRMSECLRRLNGGVRQLVTTFEPDVAALEGGFFAKNARTAMVLGMARGVVVALLAELGVPVYEYAPRRARQTVLGHGGADKEAVARFMDRMLKLDVSKMPNDATDALVLAICHALTVHTAGGLYLRDPL